MSSSLSDWLTAKARALDARGLTRRVDPRGASGQYAPLIDLANNDYLGLSQDPRIVAASVEATRTWGAGATGSRLVSGSTLLHQELEMALASWCRQPAALVFSSGYLANLGVVTALSDPGTLILADAHAHASLLDAARLSRGRLVSVGHNDVGGVESALQARSEPRALVLTESVFSVLGDAAPLPELADVCARWDAVLVVDEAHALGVTGGGRGSVGASELAGADHVVVTTTLSKALGSQGGVVLGSSVLRDHLVSRARTFMFDTALAPGAAGAARAALTVVADEPDRVRRVVETAQRIAAACQISPPAGTVLSIPMGTPERAVAAADACLRQGVRVGVFRPPAVPDGDSRLRFAARATLTDAEVAAVCRVLPGTVRTAA